MNPNKIKFLEIWILRGKTCKNGKNISLKIIKTKLNFVLFIMLFEKFDPFGDKKGKNCNLFILFVYFLQFWIALENKEQKILKVSQNNAPVKSILVNIFKWYL